MKKSFVYSVMLLFLFLLASCPNKPPVTDVDESKISITADRTFSITGVVNEQINPINLTLNIEGALFNLVELNDDKADVSSFFDTKIDGLDYKVVEPIRGVGSSTLKIEISGTPKSEVPKKTDLTITVKKGYVKDIPKDFKVSDLSYSEEIIKEDDEEVVIPKVAIASSDIVALLNQEIQPTEVRLTLTDATFADAEINKDVDGLRSWIEPKLGIIDGFEYTFKSLSDDKTELVFTITGTPKILKNTRFSVSVPKDVLSVSRGDIVPLGNGYAIEIVDEPSAEYSEFVSLDGYTNEEFQRSLGITLQDAQIITDADTIDDVSSWFKYVDSDGIEVSSLPDEISASASLDKRTSVITITLSGTPLTVNRNLVKLTIPSSIYDYANDKIDRTFYVKSPLDVDMRDLMFNIKDPDGVSVVESNKKIVALRNQKKTSTDYITLKSESLKFNASLVGNDITSSFTPSVGFKFTASEISADGLTLNVRIDDDRTDDELKNVNKSNIAIDLNASFFENGTEGKIVFTNGFSYYIVQEPTVKNGTTSSDVNVTGILNTSPIEVLYTLVSQGIKFVNPDGSLITQGSNVDSWFRNKEGEEFALPGLSYSVKSIDEAKGEIVLSINGTPTADVSGDDQTIYIVVPSDYYEYADDNLKGLPKKDISISGFNPSYMIYNIGASIAKSVTVKGKMGDGIYDKADDTKSTVDIKIQLRDITFKKMSRGLDVRSWFGEKVQNAFSEGDIIVKSDVIYGATEMTISITGTPNRSEDVPRINEKLSITIPSEYLNMTDIPNLDVNTTVADVQSMWEIAGSAIVVIEGMNAPIAALWSHPETLNNNEFIIRVIDNYFDTTLFDLDDSLGTTHKVRDLIKNLPYYLNVEYSFEYDGGSEARASAIYVKLVPRANDIEFTWNKEFGLNLWDEIFTDQDNIPIFDETSIPEIARNYCITKHPNIKEFRVNGSIIGLVGKDIGIFTNSWLTADGWKNTFLLTITLDSCYFTDDVLNSGLIESWLTNYVPVNGLSLKYLIENSISLDGMRHATSIVVYPEGIPTEAKKVFTSSDGKRTLSINSQNNSIITSTNKYAKPIPNLTLAAETIAVNTSTSTQDVCLYDGIYEIGITLKQMKTYVSQPGATSTYIMYFISRNDDNMIHLKHNTLWSSQSALTNGWIWRKNDEQFTTSQFDIVYSGYSSDADGTYNVYNFDLHDKRSKGDPPYTYEKGDLKIMIPRLDLVPPIIDFSDLLVGEDAVSLMIVATT